MGALGNFPSLDFSWKLLWAVRPCRALRITAWATEALIPTWPGVGGHKSAVEKYSPPSSALGGPTAPDQATRPGKAWRDERMRQLVPLPEVHK